MIYYRAAAAVCRGAGGEWLVASGTADQ